MAPGTGVPTISFTRTTNGFGSGWLAVPVWPSPDCAMMESGLLAEENAVKMEAAIALGRLGRKGYSESKEVLHGMLNENNFNVRKYVIKSLGSCGERDTIDLLVEIFNREESSLETKQVIAEAIGNIGGSYAMQVLKSWIFENSMEVRREALNALGNSPNEAALDILIDIMNDKKESKVIKGYAAVALKKIVSIAKNNYLTLKKRVEKAL